MQWTKPCCSSPRARRPGRRGFSFVELLVLVGILVILVSIFLPYVSKVREANRRTRCAENLIAIGLALTQYAQANSSNYPRVRTATAPAPAPASNSPATQPATTNPLTVGPAALAPQATPATPAPTPTTSPTPAPGGAAPAVAAT